MIDEPRNKNLDISSISGIIEVFCFIGEPPLEKVSSCCVKPIAFLATDSISLMHDTASSVFILFRLMIDILARIPVR